MSDPKEICILFKRYMAEGDIDAGYRQLWLSGAVSQLAMAPAAGRDCLK
jgi:hypothetical protein